MIEYMYTDRLKEIALDEEAEELFDSRSCRCLAASSVIGLACRIMPLVYGVAKIREYCLDTMACNFVTLRTTAPSAPGAVANTGQGNLLDDLSEKWLEAEAAELDKRDESALLFDNAP